METIQEIREQMEQMQLKKVLFGGYSKEDVQLKLDMMFAMFEKAMKKQLENQAAREAELLEGFEKQIQEQKDEFESKKRVSDILINDLNNNICELSTQKQVVEEANSKMQEANNALTLQKQTLEEEQRRMQDMNTALHVEKQLMEQEQRKMQEANNELTAEKQTLEEEQRRMIDMNAALRVEKHMMEEEQRKMQEANTLLTAENEQILQDQIQMREAYREYCKELLKEYSESLRSLSGEFSRILENVSSMQKEIDEESVFEGLEKAFEMKKHEMLTGTVVDCDEMEL